MPTHGDALTFRVLGPFQVVAGAQPINVGGPRLRAVLARLLVCPDRTVSVAALVEEVWAGLAPADAERTVRTYVSRLRSALGRGGDPAGRGVDLVTCAPGYRLCVPAETVDAERFEHLAVAGRHDLSAGRCELAAQRLADALALWRGEAYAEFGGYPVVAAAGARLDRLRLGVVEDRITAELAAGAGRDLATELEGLVLVHPERERLWGLLMTTLYRAGRQAEALAVFRDARTALVDEHGVEPSPELAEIHQRILAQDPRLAPAGRVNGARSAPSAVPPQPSAAQLPAGTSGPVPAQLPLVVRAFAGRQAELARLDAVLAQTDPADPTGPAAVVISAVSGTAGVGKTALAVYWANRVRAKFPDGQLYVNLRGFDPGPAVEPATAVHGFLDALGVQADRIPTDLAARTSLYRSLLADKRILVLLDNASDAEQVRPLLPGAPGCLVVVTSRDELTSLVAIEGAYPVALDLLSADEARQMVTGRLDAQRVAAEPEAVARLITLCAGLPLALAIATARVASRPNFRLGTIAEELARSRGSLDGWTAGDSTSEARSVFSWSYRALGGTAARLFRLYGLHPGADIAAPAAASLADVPLAAIATPLAELTGAHLLTEHTPGRYTCHDLLGAYAAELAHARPDPDAPARVLDYYLQTAYRGARCLAPHRDPITLAAPGPGVVQIELNELAVAMTWFAVEHANLLAATRYAFDTGCDVQAWQLAWALETFLDRQGYRDDLAETQRIALAAGQRLGDQAVEAGAQLRLGIVAMDGRALEAATAHFGQAGQLFLAVDDHNGQARTRLNLGVVCARAGRTPDALDHAQQALAHFRTAGNRIGEARALNSIGWYLIQLGDHAQSLVYCEQAFRAALELDDQYGQATSSDSCACAHHHLGQFDEAATCFQRSVDLFRQLGGRHNEATALTHRGDTYRAAGSDSDARTAWQSALDILDPLGHPDAERVRDKLRADLPASH